MAVRALTSHLWKRAGRYYEQSDCGRFRIATVKAPDAWRFIAWKNTAKGPRMLGVFDSSGAARKACGARG